MALVACLVSCRDFHSGTSVGAAIESSVLHLTGGAYGYSKIPPSLAIEEFSVEVVAKDDNMDSTCYHASLGERQTILYMLHGLSECYL